MQLNLVPASEGLAWFRKGVKTFLRCPTIMLSILFSYFCLIGLASTIPYIGKIISSIVTPLLSNLFFITSQSAYKKNLNFSTILNFFWKDFSPEVRKKILPLGVLYFLFTNAGTTLLTTLAKNSLSKEFFAFSQYSSFLPTVIFAIFILIPSNILLCFSPIFIVRKKTSIGQAFFYSAIAIWKNFSAYLIFIACWIMAATLLLSISTIPKLIGLGGVAAPIMLFASLILLSSFYSSICIIYQECFKEN